VASLSYITLLGIMRCSPSKIFETRWTFNLVGKWASINVLMLSLVKYIATCPKALDEVTTGGLVAIEDVLPHPLPALTASDYLSVFCLSHHFLFIYNKTIKFQPCIFSHG